MEKELQGIIDTVTQDIKKCLYYVIENETQFYGNPILHKKYCEEKKLPTYIFEPLTGLGAYIFDKYNDIFKLKGRMDDLLKQWFLKKLQKDGAGSFVQYVFNKKYHEIIPIVYQFLFKINPKIVRHVRFEWMLSDEEFFEFIRKNPTMYRFMPKKYHTEEIVQKLLSETYKNFKHIPNRLKTKEMCDVILTKNIGYFRYVPYKFRDTKSVLHQNQENAYKKMLESPYIENRIFNLLQIPKEIRKDYKIQIIKNN